MGVALSELNSGNWMVERRVRKELSIGLLNGRALEIIEIKYKKDFYDYDTKYHSGSTEYLCPADLPYDISNKIKSEAETIFKNVVAETLAYRFYFGALRLFLEVNTIPGMTHQAFIPKPRRRKVLILIP